MSNIVKKHMADKLIFKHQPRSIFVETTKVAKDFVSLQSKATSNFQIAPEVAEQAGVEAIRKKNLEIQVEETVLSRLKAIEEPAYNKAFELGLIEGTEKAFCEKKAEFEGIIIRLEQLLNLMNEYKLRMIIQNEEGIIRLIHNLASRIAMREISLDREPIIKMISDITEEIQNAEAISIYLNPEDILFVESLREKLARENSRLERVKFVPDPSISEGGCKVSTELGSIDVTVEERISRAWQVLESKLPHPNKGTEV